MHKIVPISVQSKYVEKLQYKIKIETQNNLFSKTDLLNKKSAGLLTDVKHTIIGGTKL